MYEPLETVQNVDVERYTGLWYEIARLPTSFQEGCVGTTAEYSLRDDGKINVVNTCREDTLDGPVERIEGTARVVDEETNAKLGVTFFWPFEGPYWILELDEDYQWAMVGSPDRDMLWFLSRTPTLDEEIYNQLVESAEAKGFDTSNLIQTPQPPGG
jgi:apolipoprotein D and lipocalin family protein